MNNNLKKLSKSTLESLKINTVIESLVLLNNKLSDPNFIREVISDLEHDIELMEGDNYPTIIEYREHCIKQVKELKALLG